MSCCLAEKLSPVPLPKNFFNISIMFYYTFSFESTCFQSAAFTAEPQDELLCSPSGAGDCFKPLFRKARAPVRNLDSRFHGNITAAENYSRQRNRLPLVAHKCLACSSALLILPVDSGSNSITLSKSANAPL